MFNYLLRIGIEVKLGEGKGSLKNLLASFLEFQREDPNRNFLRILNFKRILIFFKILRRKFEEEVVSCSVKQVCEISIILESLFKSVFA